MELVGTDERGAELRERLAADGVVASLMLIHGLYPVGLDERVAEALDSVRPYMESHGGNVELLGIEDGVARIQPGGQLRRLPGLVVDARAGDQVGARRGGARPRGPGGRGRGGGAEARHSRAGVARAAGGPGRRRPRPRRRVGSTLGAADGLAEGELVDRERQRGGADRRPGRGQCARLPRPLRRLRRRARRGGARRGDARRAPSASGGFFLPRAGRSLDDERLLLEPLPLLDGAGGSRVAIPGAAPAL